MNCCCYYYWSRLECCPNVNSIVFPLIKVLPQPPLLLLLLLPTIHEHLPVPGTLLALSLHNCNLYSNNPKKVLFLGPLCSWEKWGLMRFHCPRSQSKWLALGLPDSKLGLCQPWHILSKELAKAAQLSPNRSYAPSPLRSTLPPVQ